MEQEKRSAVIELHRAGRSAQEIISLLKYPSSTVYTIINRYKATGVQQVQTQPQKFLAGLRKSINAFPTKSMSALAKDRSVHRSTIFRAIKHDLGYKSYVMKVRHLLTDKMKATREARCRKILSSLKNTGGHLRFFCDEKIFTLDKKRNRQNDRWICREASEVPMVFRTKNPAAVMVLGVISSEGHVMPPHFFEPKQKVNQEVYLEPWIDTVASGRKYTFQQDSAPAHKAKTVQAWLKENTWPSNSQISTLVTTTCRGSWRGRPALKSSITSVAMSLEAAEVSRSVRAFRSRVETVVEAGGGHIE
ncbi:Transposable element tcb2 transposase [Caligus rogercresseyi]|uniref:Transposable element tcb2 transposase n=1 Tax=Caligus rogercresseyi TaxID=217165 RepID=A0A7T8GXK6_CALRO|nr:Transposable element tcb2 transposase [Caligus rogercresseyi]